MHVKDYRITKEAYVIQVYAQNADRHDIDPGCLNDDHFWEEGLVDCPPGRVWRNIGSQVRADSELCMFKYTEGCEVEGFGLRRPHVLA